jgi:hypothetical protein
VEVEMKVEMEDDRSRVRRGSGVIMNIGVEAKS